MPLAPPQRRRGLGLLSDALVDEALGREIGSPPAARGMGLLARAGRDVADLASQINQIGLLAPFVPPEARENAQLLDPLVALSDVSRAGKDFLQSSPENIIGRTGNLGLAALGIAPAAGLQRVVAKEAQKEIVGPLFQRADQFFAERQSQKALKNAENQLPPMPFTKLSYNKTGKVGLGHKVDPRSSVVREIFGGDTEKIKKAMNLGFDRIFFHYSPKVPSSYKTGKSNFPFDQLLAPRFGKHVDEINPDFLGPHLGTYSAAASRRSFFDSEGVEPVPFLVRLGKPILSGRVKSKNAPFSKVMTEGELQNFVSRKVDKLKSDGVSDEFLQARLIRELRKEGDYIPYFNDVEDPGSISIISLDPYAQIRVPEAAFRENRRGSIISSLVGAGLLGLGAREENK